MTTGTASFQIISYRIISRAARSSKTPTAVRIALPALSFEVNKSYNPGNIINTVKRHVNMYDVQYVQPVNYAENNKHRPEKNSIHFFSQ